MDTASFRLPEELVRAVAAAAARRRVDRSTIVREALSSYLERISRSAKMSTAELIDTLVTYPGSGCGDLATRSEQHLRARFHARRRPR
jgi:metal-responsive CopG/Arc/MetJ family transcriptional regulator